jgi:hypothetical protein
MIFVPLDSRERTQGDPYNALLELSYPIRNPKRIHLLSLELPYSHYNVRSPYNTITINGVTRTIAEGEYDVDELISAVTNAFDLDYTFTLSSSTSKVTLSCVSSAIITTKSPWCVAQMLGFTNNQLGTEIIASNSVNCGFDLYLNMLITNLPTNTQSRIPTTFRVPLSSSQGSLSFLWANNSFHQYFDLDGETNLTHMRIVFQDRFGNIVNNNGCDWSGLLGIEL